MTEAILLVACLVLAAAVGVLAAGLRQLRTGLAAELAAIRAELSRQEARERRSPGLVTGGTRPEEPRDEASRRVAHSSTNGRAPSSTSGVDEYVITRLGADENQAPEPALESRLFADLVLRESVVKAASFAYGVRRGLSPANRNRIWFEMRREVKRARKQRKADEREAVREWRARQRASLREEDAA